MYARKAGEDAVAATRLAPDEEIADSVVGFHAQQAVEKWLKAVMASRDLAPPRTHDITRLVELLQAEGVELPRSHEQLDELTIYAVPLRYDELLDTEPLDRAKAIGCVDEVAAWARDQLEQE